MNLEDQKIKPAPVGAVARVHAPAILATTHQWILWAEIAIDSSIEATEARSKLTSGPKDAWSARIRQETRPSVVAITASAHALESLRYAVAPIVIDTTTVRDWRKNRTAKHATIHETLRRATYAPPSRDALEWLFGLRDDSIHFVEQPKAVKRHPALDTNVAPEHVRFSSEGAERAVEILLGALKVLATNPRKPAFDWSQSMSPTIERLEERRVST